MSDKKTYTCTFPGCTSAFNRPYRLAQHRLVHVNVKPFECHEENCSKAYTSKSHLDRHINNIHRHTDLDILYCCPICMKNYANRQNLKRHIKQSHNSNKEMFTCNYCFASFKKKHQIKAHMYQHTGVRPFRCSICSKEYITLTDQKKHMRNHKVYQCELCDSKFNRWSDMISHKGNVHNLTEEFKCNECNQIFKNRTQILRHLRKHMRHDARPKYFCPYDECQSQYSRNSNLKQHILVKHEGYTYDCRHCGTKLSSKAKLNKHIEKHSKPEVVITIPKTLQSGRKRRKDYNSWKVSSAMKIAGIVSEENEVVRQALDVDGSSGENNFVCEVESINLDEP